MIVARKNTDFLCEANLVLGLHVFMFLGSVVVVRLKRIGTAANSFPHKKNQNNI